MSDKSNENKITAYPAGDKLITFNTPLVMAIINLTPDSFYDGGRYGELKDTLQDIEEKLNHGADIIDLGAASSRPGAAEINEGEEWIRLKDVLRETRKHFPDCVISVDTYRSGIARKCADLGANVINDISAGKLDKQMFTTMAELQLPYVMMHMQGTPQTMQLKPQYSNVVEEIISDFRTHISSLTSLGFSKLILDPGFGFGKNLDHNYRLLKQLHSFTEFGYPVLAGVSRKNMINKVIGTSAVTALNGSTVLHTIALLNGASLLRVHDVAEAKQAIALVDFYKNV